MKHALRLAVVALATALGGCATTNNSRDPLEGFNRTMFGFNDKVDQVALKPAAQAYRTVLPNFVQTGVGNFFSNLGDVWTGINNILQGKINDGVTDFGRFTINSTFGIFGLVDLSSDAGIPKHKEDFGQTLGKWGIGPGPYLVLPLLGSSTLRDAAALPLDFKGDLWSYTRPVNVRNIGTGVRLLDARAAVLDASDLIEGAALDRYEFVRDAFLQRRQSRINDGEGPRVKPEDSTAPGHNQDAGPTLENGAPAAPAVPAGKSSQPDGAVPPLADVAALTDILAGAEPVSAFVIKDKSFVAARILPVVPAN